MWKGIDVSDNQGTINWAQIPEDVDFAVLRSVRRSGKADHQFATNLEGCRKHNIPVSVYKYTYAATQDAARQEAQQVVELLRSHHLSGAMVWWDVEDKDVLRPLGAAKADGVYPCGAGGYHGSRVRFWAVCWAVCV